MTRRDMIARSTAALIGGTLVGSLAGRETALPPRMYATGGFIPASQPIMLHGPETIFTPQQIALLQGALR